MVFDGRNIIFGLPEQLIKTVQFLLMKEAEGEFVFTNDLVEWDRSDKILDSFDMDYGKKGYYRAVGLAYVVDQVGEDFSIDRVKNYYGWSKALRILAPIVGWECELLAGVIRKFPLSEDVVEYNIKGALRDYSKADFKAGITILSHFPEYRVDIKTGLMENDFQKYCKLFPPKSDWKDYRLAAIIFFLSSFSTSSDVQKELKETRERQVLELLRTGDTTSLVEVICNWISFQSNTSKFIEDCILLLIKGLPVGYDVALVVKLDKALHGSVISSDLMKKIALCFIETHNSTDVIRMEHSIRELNENQENFVEFVLFFILNCNHLCRFIGRSLWDKYYLETSNFNIFDLTEENQIVFSKFMLEDFGNPERRLPKVLPLLGSKSEKVRIIFMNLIKPYIDDYMGHVICELDKLQIQTSETVALRDYYAKRAKFVSLRRELKELSPALVDYQVYKESIRCEKNHITNLLNESELKSSTEWMNLFPKVVLARGGGWRKSDGSTTPLAEIQHSVPARQMLQSMSPIEQDEWIKTLMHNYDTKGDY